MQFIQIDNFNGTLNIVCKDDGSGDPLIFDTYKEAKNTLDENCQDGIIVPLGNTTKVLEDCAAFIDRVKFLLGEDVDKDNLEQDVLNLIH